MHHSAEFYAGFLTLAVTALAFIVSGRIAFAACTRTGQIVAVISFLMLVVLAPLWIPPLFILLDVTLSLQTKDLWSFLLPIMMVAAFQFGTMTTVAGIAGAISYLITGGDHRRKFKRTLLSCLIVAAIAFLYPLLTSNYPVT